ncbi:proton-associated sugar transporter A-like [Haliotis rufescens]|uniref:proton-associated sugar transporter A-like n=1 Tax=Haliotis rufescens TaxID=6454 RepID=UPI001EAFE047|nr:proton-associated sugar transporter A-like [Haliotis rufescens]
MSVGIIRALKTFKDHPYVQYVGLGLAGLVNIENQDGDHTVSRKSKLQLIRLSTAVCGIELCYAAETAFVSPILLKLGVPVALMTLVWCLSPVLGFFLVPVLGSLSDRCPIKMGRRRPFILILSAGIVLGLLLVPNGESIGILLGDKGNETLHNTYRYVYNQSYHEASKRSFIGNISLQDVTPIPIAEGTDMVTGTTEPETYSISKDHFRGIILTIVGVAMLDFNCDACQSPSRAYLLDVTLPEDHSSGLTMFTVMAGIGGSIGYIMGGVDWNATEFGTAFGGHIRVVFFLVLIVFIICVISTATSFKETELKDLGISKDKIQKKKKKVGKSKYRKFTNEEDDDEEEEIGFSNEQTYGALGKPGLEKLHSDHDLHKGYTADSEDDLPSGNNMEQHTEADRHTLTQSQGTVTSSNADDKDHPIEISTDVTLKTYLRSIVKMPRSLFILCLTNLFCWMSLVCYSLYFTDFVGQVVYNGDPQAPTGSDAHNRYDDGVRLGSFGMSLYSFSCAVYSLCIEKLVRTFKAKRVYVCGQLTYTVGMVILSLVRHKVAVIVLSPTAGIMYATLFTMPYLLVANYHTRGEFNRPQDEQVRGLGTDVALISSMVFLAQFLLSVSIGSIIHAVGSTTAVIVAAAILSFCGAITATQVTYFDV